MTDCDTALRAFAARDFREWAGLPRACSLGDLEKIAPPPDDWRGAAFLGETQASYAMLTLDGYARPVRVYLQGDRGLMLEAQFPQVAPDTASLLAALGEPEAKLDSHLGTLRLAGSEWVYPGRGLTLFVNPANGVLLRLAAYAPTTLQAYERELRVDHEVHRLPMRPLPSP